MPWQLPRIPAGPGGLGLIEATSNVDCAKHADDTTSKRTALTAIRSMLPSVAHAEVCLVVCTRPHQTWTRVSTLHAEACATRHSTRPSTRHSTCLALA